MEQSDSGRIEPAQTIREIKRLFRMSMNGIVSASMRQRGIDYKLNFGLTRPMLVRIASKFEPNSDLAEALWNDRVRESRLLAPMLCPLDSMSEERAWSWVDKIEYPELADQCCMELFEKLPFASQLAKVWIEHDEDLVVYTGYQLLNRLLKKKGNLSLECGMLLTRSKNLLSVPIPLFLQTAILNFLKHSMRFDGVASSIFSLFSVWEKEPDEYRRAIVHELYEEYQYRYADDHNG